MKEVPSAARAASRKSNTDKHIKDSLLKLLAKKEYTEITVTDICRESGVSRGTFYSHYKNIQEIIDELFDDALYHVGNVPLKINHPEICKDKDGIALCGFLRKNKKYQPLFFDDALYSQAVRCTVDALTEDFLTKMRLFSKMRDKELKDLLYYQISGCMALCRLHIKRSDGEWKEIQDCIDCFLLKGFRNIDK